MAPITATNHTHDDDRAENERKAKTELANYTLLLATLVATVTYAAGFSPPGGVWQYTVGHLPGDPIIRSTQYVRYMVFFYCNATAFASSLIVLVLILLLSFRPQKKLIRIIVTPLVLVMLLGLLSLIGAYAAGTFRDTFTAVYTSLLVAAVFTYVVVERAVAAKDVTRSQDREPQRDREVLMQLAAFVLTTTYVGGLSTPGGFWDSTEGGKRPGDPILKGARLAAFFVCNTTAFVASLLIIAILLVRKIRRTIVAYGASIAMVCSLLGSYLAGSSRETHTTIYMVSLICAIVAYNVLFHIVIWTWVTWNRDTDTDTWRQAVASGEDSEAWKKRMQRKRKERGYSRFIQYLATLALTITFQAGLHPPGGLWQDNGDGHMAGDPILHATNSRRYKAFFYCNSVAFGASLVCMILLQIRPLLKYRALELAMIVDLLGLVGAYAIGSSRDGTTTVYAMGIGGAALVYVVLHVIILGPEKVKDDPSLDRLVRGMGYGLFQFAIFVPPITYLAGLSPPGGFLLKDDEFGHRAGDPVLLHNNPRRYAVFFYCNSTSFMVSIAIIILLVNENFYKPAMKTHALSICTVVSFFCLLAAFAAGTTQHLKTSMSTLVLLAVVFVFTVSLLLVFFLRSKFFPSASASKADSEDLPIELIPITAEENDQATADDADRPIELIPITPEENGQATADDADRPIELIPITAEENGQAAADDADQPIKLIPITSEEIDQATADDADRPIKLIPITSEEIDQAVADVADRSIEPTYMNPEERERVRRIHDSRMYMMMVGILVASVTYQASLDPPGGSWQGNSDSHKAGDPVMQNNRRKRYLFFFYSNSTSFMASIFLMVLLLPKMSSFTQKKPWSVALNAMLMLVFLGLLGAYATGSSRQWKTCWHVVAIVFSVLAYFSIHIAVSLLWHKYNRNRSPNDDRTISDNSHGRQV